MRSRLVKFQLIAFVVVAVLGIVYVGAKYVRLDNLLGFGQYTVHLQLAQSGGIYQNAEVTYRGVPVGRVGDMSLTKDGISVALMLDNGGPKIPSSTRAVVADRSAIGEQYVDLEPDRDEGPYLHDNDVIAQQFTATPVPVQDLIKSVDNLASSVPLDDLRKTVNELGIAFDGKGDDLQTLVDSLNAFTQTGIENLPQTLALIRDGRTVLDTQADEAGSIRTFSDGLDKVTAQLRSSDPDVRRLIGTGTDASNAVGELIKTSGPSLTQDLGNLRLLLQGISPEAYVLKPLLQLLPALSIGGSSTAPGDGTTHFGLVLETNNPPACTIGYEGTQATLKQMKAQNPNFDDTKDDFPFNTNASCKVPHGSITDVRGSANAKYADPDTVQPWDSTPKTDPDKLNLTPVATQLATLIGVTPKR